MGDIFRYIDYNAVNFVDNYDTPIRVHTYTNVKFRTENSNFLNFYTPVGISDNKIISITNRQLSFLVQNIFIF